MLRKELNELVKAHLAIAVRVCSCEHAGEALLALVGGAVQEAKLVEHRLGARATVGLCTQTAPIRVCVRGFTAASVLRRCNACSTLRFVGLS